MSETVFFRVLKIPVDAKGDALAAQIAALDETGEAEEIYALDPADFALIPGSPFAYWASNRVRHLFVIFSRFEYEGRTAKAGLCTGDDFRFVRNLWEVPAEAISDGRWRLFAKGGDYSLYHSDPYLVVDWGQDGAKIKNGARDGSLPGARPQNVEYYFRPGLTWSLRTTSELSVRALPADCIFGHKGPSAFLSNDDPDELLVLLAVMNSTPFEALITLQLGAAAAAARSYEVGVIQRTPIPLLADHATRTTLATLAREAHDLQRERDRADETTHAFCLPGLARHRERSLREATRILYTEEQATQARLSAIQSDIDDLVFDLYGLSAADRELIRREMGESANQRISESANQQISKSANEQPEDTEHGLRNTQHATRPADDVTEDEVPSPPEDLSARVQNLLMWCVGVAFGRWDVHKALDPALLPPLGGPFDPLPRCAPGALVGSNGLPAFKDTPPVPLSPCLPVSLSPGPPILIAWNGILVDDPTHPSDVVTRVRGVLALLYGEQADVIEREACQILGFDCLRDYFRDPRQGFFPFHIKRYSKSRRKAPIYWLLQSEKRNYAIWLYCHRLTPATLYAAGRDYADAKVVLEVGRLEELRLGLERLAGSARKRHDQEIERQQRLVAEVTDFRNRLDAIALRNLPPDLNDGVLISIAPLWELVPWKEAQWMWEKLVAGEYEWSTMARRMRERGRRRSVGG